MSKVFAFGSIGLVVAAGFASLVATAGTAKAETYPWCAIYSAGRDGGGENCGFVSLAQCRATIYGVGGYCAENPAYPAPKKRVEHRRHREG